MNLLLEVWFVESWESMTDGLLCFDSPYGLAKIQCNSQKYPTILHIKPPGKKDMLGRIWGLLGGLGRTPYINFWMPPHGACLWKSNIYLQGLGCNQNNCIVIFVKYISVDKNIQMSLKWVSKIGKFVIFKIRSVTHRFKSVPTYKNKSC